LQPWHDICSLVCAGFPSRTILTSGRLCSVLMLLVRHQMMGIDSRLPIVNSLPAPSRFFIGKVAVLEGAKTARCLI
jgi:hypothetical protein